MKFFEYGKENKKTLMIECGYLAKWYPGLMPFINEAKHIEIFSSWIIKKGKAL